MHAPCQCVAPLATNSLHSDLSKASSIAFSKVRLCKMYSRSGFRPNHTGGTPRWSGGGSLPSAQKSLPTIGLRPRILTLRGSGVPQKDLGSVSNQHCCKGSCFTEKLTNTATYTLRHTALVSTFFSSSFQHNARQFITEICHGGILVNKESQTST